MSELVRKTDDVATKVADPLFTDLPVGTGVLDQVPDLPEELRKAERALKYWKVRVEELQGALRMVAGEHETLTLHGEPAFTYNYINTFQGKKFEKEQPDLYRAYLEEKKVQQLNVELLKLARPDVYRLYQSRQLRTVA
jgi:hypothetical protein